MAETNVNLNYCGIINLFRQLIQKEFLQNRRQKIAAGIGDTEMFINRNFDSKNFISIFFEKSRKNSQNML